jgi:M6 family metalloprotease-like protein
MRTHHRKILFGLVAVLATVGPGRAFARPPYPATPPDFTQPDPRHGQLMTPTSGDNDRPVLVLDISFTDAPAPPGKDAAFFSNLFFGSGFGSVADYYRAQSFGKFLLTPAADTQGSTTDGVVELTMGKQADFDGPVNDGLRARQALTSADRYVNFAAFDRNRDKHITPDELLVYLIENRPEFCGGTRNVGPTLMLDGVDLGNRTWSGSTTTSNAMTAVHELSHQAFGAIDPPDYSWGSFDVHGPTCIPPAAGGAIDQSFWGFDSWEKLHLGWIHPTVVTRDGWYAVRRADLTGDAYVLYDPAKGTSNYLLVENRERTPDTYDKDVADSGLVITRIDESVYGEASPWVEILSPPSTFAAWDPSDPSTPQANVAPSWRDTTASGIAIRAIGGHGDPIIAYFDVRGPGVFIDGSRVPLFNVWRGATREFTIPVTNTGETTDTFAVTLAPLPAGWTASTVNVTLGPRATGNVTLKVTPSLGAAHGDRWLPITAHSISDPSVTTTRTFKVFVALPLTHTRRLPVMPPHAPPRPDFGRSH